MASNISSLKTVDYAVEAIQSAVALDHDCPKWHYNKELFRFDREVGGGYDREYAAMPLITFSFEDLQEDWLDA